MMRGWGWNDGNSSGSDGEGSRERRSKETRVFCVSVDVRSFKATMHLPMRSANVFIRVVLPPEIVRVAVESCSMSSKVTAPLRTHPPVLVNRGTEVNISSGYVALELPASPDGMAAMLAMQPEVVAHVLHRDKYAADSVLGVASIPMKRLMEQPLVDGYAPVQGALNVGGKIEDVKIGSLRVVLAIEDMGPVRGPDVAKLKIGASPGHVRLMPPDDPSVTKLKTGYLFGSAGSVEEGEAESDGTPEDAELGKVRKELPKADTEAPGNQKRKGNSPNCRSSYPRKIPCSTSDTDETAKRAGGCREESVRKQPEYEMAWEFEMWRRSEEAKWRANLKEKEAARIDALEEEWRKREKQRALEMRNYQAEQADLEAKLRAKLFKLEKRERAIGLVEEEAAHRKEALERAYANRLSDAQVAVKRLQSECEHRVELERAKYTALQEQYAALEQRLAIANGSLATVEKQFQEFKAAQRNTSEAELAGQVMALKQQCGNLQRKVESAFHARDDYKGQVLKMAKELARLHRERTEAQTQQASQERSRLESQTVAALMESQSQKAREDRLELQRLKEQLDLLQLREQEAMAIQAASQNFPRKLPDRQPPSDHSSPPPRRTTAELPRHDLSKVHDGRDTIPPADLRVFQDTSEVPKSAGPGAATWAPPRQPLAEMGQKQKEPPLAPAAVGAAKGRCPIVETRYHDLRLIDIENEDHNLYDSESSAASRGKVEYLLKQRADLLRTGVYSVSDRVIRGLDQEIQQLRSGGWRRSSNPYENPSMSP